ncbi:hypothetical protein [Pseudonocardia sediminis]|nr:hypothetical protein [Pseudonocardia sediminis]
MTVSEFWTETNRVWLSLDRFRWGQAASLVLARVRPDLSAPLRGGPADPFYAVDSREPRSVAFAEYVNRRWEEA